MIYPPQRHDGRGGQGSARNQVLRRIIPLGNRRFCRTIEAEVQVCVGWQSGPGTPMPRAGFCWLSR